MTSNFDFVRAEWPTLFEEAAQVERRAQLDPRGSVFHARRAVELTVKWIVEFDPAVTRPYDNSLNALMHEPSFKGVTGSVFTKMDLIRRRGNHAIHETRPVTAQTSMQIVRELWHVMFWFSSQYAQGERPIAGTQFDVSLVPVPGAARAAAEKSRAELQQMAAEMSRRDEALEAERAANEELQAEIERLRAEVPATKLVNAAEPIDHDLDEAATRVQYIDLLLAEAGWELDDSNFEVEVAGMPNQADRGRVDYVLWGEDGKPLALIEAKRTQRDAVVGQQQAKLYADALEAEHGQRPVIFYSNGYEHWMWDDAFYPPRTVDGFYTRDGLALLVQRRSSRGSIAAAEVDSSIVERSYQVEATRKIAAAFEADHERKALVVMATGAGKTRTVIALVDLLMKQSWAKRVLFLADRIALVKQAANAFKAHLPDVPTVNLLEDKTAEGRIYFSTYPTMMGLIDDLEDGQRRFGPGHFDLVVIDEAHRSVYQKYRAIFVYFDSLLVGLTATPKDDIDHNTYSLFELEDGVPTAAYDLGQAIEDGYLVPGRAMKVGLEFPQRGIKYEDLTEEEKERWDALEWTEDGQVPDGVGAEAVNSWLFNEDTVDKILATLMTEGHKVAGGDRLGKTIIFAKNNDHAQFIARRFDANYPAYMGHFARVLTYKTEYVQSLIDSFAVPEGEPHIAISVDLLDTGIDIPEIVNLVLFKQVRSKTKFWQMIGRGTRLRPDLYGPGEPKTDFLVFDVCNNIEFFSVDLEGGGAPAAEPLRQRLFKARADLINVLDRTAASASLRTDLRDTLQSLVSGMNTNSFVVRPHRRMVEKWSSPDAWSAVDAEARAELDALSGLPSDDVAEDEEAKRFDLLMLRTQLDLLTDGSEALPRREQIQAVAQALLEQTNIPAVQAKQVLLEAVVGDEWWIDVTVDMLEEARRNLRSLVRLIDRAKRGLVYTDFTDRQAETTEVDLPQFSTAVDLGRFKAKARAFLFDHDHEIAVQRLRRNQQVTAVDIETIERLIIETGTGTPEELEKAAHEAEGLGLFIRGLVGLKRSAAEQAFSQFLADHAVNAPQTEFLRVIVEQLTYRGHLDAAALYEKPFTDVAASGPDLMFPDGELDSVIEILDGVRKTAVA